MKYRDMSPEQREARKAYMKQYYEEHREEQNARVSQYMAEDLNKKGVRKHNIRIHSGRILKKVHGKLDGYEIHHCFGYEDPKKFIYIQKKLHLQIHQLLRDLGISADENHWSSIRDLVNSCEEYTYIRC